MNINFTIIFILNNKQLLVYNHKNFSIAIIGSYIKLNNAEIQNNNRGIYNSS